MRLGTKGPAVCDFDDDALIGGEVGDADGGAHGEGAVGGGEGVLIEDAAVGCGAVVVRGAVPAGEADLGGDGGAEVFGLGGSWGLRERRVGTLAGTSGGGALDGVRGALGSAEGNLRRRRGGRSGGSRRAGSQ